MNRPLSTFALAPKTREALRNAGFLQSQDVLSLSPVQLARALELSTKEALELHRVVKAGCKPIDHVSEHKEKTGPLWSMSCLDMLKKERQSRFVVTLCKELDAVLGGGVRLGELTEFAGVPGIGKTQLATQLACNVTIPTVFGGVEGSCLYIDTEGSFLPLRCRQMAVGVVDYLKRCVQRLPKEKQKSVITETMKKLGVPAILSKIDSYRLYSLTEQIACVQFALPKYLEKHPECRLVVVDSIAFHLRAWKGSFRERNRILAQLSESLLQCASEHEVAVVCVNQVTTVFAHQQTKPVVGEKRGRMPPPRSEGDATTTPVLGRKWAEACSNRVELFWGPGFDGQVFHSQRFARLTKSSGRPLATARFSVHKSGIR